MRKMKDSGIEWIGEIPDGWELNKIGSLYSERNEKVNDVDYKALSVTKNGIVPQLESAAKSGRSDNRKLIKKGDFVINSRSDRKGSCGISCYDGSCSLINTVLKTNSDFVNLYYEFVFKSELFAEEFYRWGHGIVDDLWSTKWTDMKRIYIPFPVIEEQNKIANFLDNKCSKIDEAIAKQENLIEKLKEYKQSLITETVTKGLDPNAKMKSSGIDWIGEIPEDWNVIPLKRLTTLITDGTHQTPNYIDRGIPFLSIKDVSSGKINFSDTKYISNEEHIILRKHAPVEMGDIIFTRIGTLGIALVVDCDVEFDIFVSLGLIKIKTDLIYNKWLAYNMNSKHYFNYIQLVKAGGGTSAAKYNLGDVEKSYIILPTLSEQKQIVNFLDKKCCAIDASVKKYQQSIEKLQEYKKSLIYEYVTGKKEVS